MYENKYIETKFGRHYFFPQSLPLSSRSVTRYSKSKYGVRIWVIVGISPNSQKGLVVNATASRVLFSFCVPEIETTPPLKSLLLFAINLHNFLLRSSRSEEKRTTACGIERT